MIVFRLWVRRGRRELQLIFSKGERIKALKHEWDDWYPTLAESIDEADRIKWQGQSWFVDKLRWEVWPDDGNWAKFFRTAGKIPSGPRPIPQAAIERCSRRQGSMR